MKPKTALRLLFTLGILIVFFPAIALAGGPVPKKRTFSVTNATKGDNPQAICYNSDIVYRLTTEGDKTLPTQNGGSASSGYIIPDGTKKLFPYYDINKNVRLQVKIENKCLNWSITTLYGKRCTKRTGDYHELSLGQLPPTSHYEVTQDCKITKVN